MSGASWRELDTPGACRKRSPTVEWYRVARSSMGAWPSWSRYQTRSKSLRGRRRAKRPSRRIRVEEREDSSGERALYIVLTLSDPPRGEDTWPVDDLWALRSKVRVAVSEESKWITEPWFVMFEPEHPGELDSDDLHEQLNADS